MECHGNDGFVPPAAKPEESAQWRLRFRKRRYQLGLNKLSPIAQAVHFRPQRSVFGRYGFKTGLTCPVYDNFDPQHRIFPLYNIECRLQVVTVQRALYFCEDKKIQAVQLVQQPVDVFCPP